MPSCCLMVTAAPAILFRINWRYINQVFHVHSYFQQPQQQPYLARNKPSCCICSLPPTTLVVRVGAGIVHDSLIGLYLLLQWRSAQFYCVFLEGKLPEMLEEILLVLRRNMWFPYNGAVAHFAHQVQEHLISTYSNC